MIEVAGLGKRFGTRLAVEDVTFRASDGQITGLLGPNGAGKTTSLRVLAGLLRPDRGRALVDGADVTRQPGTARQALGVLPETAGLYGRLTAREHLEYAASLHGLSGRDRDASVDRTIEVFGMDGLASRRTAGFSQGERRKVALARALVHDPQNVLLDEPTNGLDVMSIRSVRRQVRRLADAGKCVVLSTHVMQEVAALCDRIVILARGRVVAEGTPAEILAAGRAAGLEDAFVALIGTEEGLN
jgi:sodium transport system ATP-binding protein